MLLDHNVLPEHLERLTPQQWSALQAEMHRRSRQPPPRTVEQYMGG